MVAQPSSAFSWNEMYKSDRSVGQPSMSVPECGKRACARARLSILLRRVKYFDLSPKFAHTHHMAALHTHPLQPSA
jgi:hypothetical protein